MIVHPCIEQASCSFGEYCISVCKAKCCSRGFLPLTCQEKSLFTPSRINALDQYDLTGGCEHLDKATNRCGIYGQRPFMCRSYPFVLRYKTIYAYSSCNAFSDKHIALQDCTFPEEFKIFLF